MINRILYTFLSKVLVAAINFFIVVITAHHMGADGRGIISLIVLSISLSLIINNFVGGAALVYLASRKSLFELLVPSYLWAIISAVIVSVGMQQFSLVPSEYVLDVLLLSFLQSISSIHLTTFIGKEKIKQYNIINTVQIILVIAYLLFSIYVLEDKRISVFVYSQYVGFGYSFIVTTIIVWKELAVTPLRQMIETLKSIFHNSIYIQLASLVQIINYRLSFYLLNKHLGEAPLGIYTTAVSVAESLWLISKSMVTVQYSKIVNSTDIKQSQELTLQLSKLSFLLTITGGIIIVLLPAGFFTWLFGKDFHDVKHILIYLIPGIACIAHSTLYAHYYAGIGKNHINTIASSTGFVITIILCFILIPTYHLVGAAISASASYLGNTIYLFYIFKKDSGYSFTEFLPSKKDYQYLLLQLKEFVK